jgi:gas vesicle protein
MFNTNTAADTKIAVLEERLSSYELMLNKIDEAIQLMGKTSQNISKMLAVHNERLEQCSKTDDLIVNMIDDMKSENKEQHTRVEKRISGLEKKIEEFTKFRWVIAGALVIFSFVISNSHMVVDILTPDTPPGRISQPK